MASEEEWLSHCLSWEDPLRIRSCQELENWIGEVGFLPLFRNEIPGFSVEEHTAARFWFSGDPEQDPWLWREQIARKGRIAYGKFFAGKAGFISPEWLPYFANCRRDGYDFDSLWEEGLASRRSRLIMDTVEKMPGVTGPALKIAAGFGKGGEKNFSGIVTGLQMQLYLVASDFRRKISRAGTEYGMPVTVYATPEQLWGYDAVTAAYSEDPRISAGRIAERVRSCFPWAEEDQLKKVLK